MSLKLNLREAGNVHIVDLSGRLTLGEPANTLRDTIRELVASGRKRILINFAELSFLDSSGIGVLVGGFATVTNQGGQIKLVNLNKRVKDLLLLTKLYTVFDVFEDQELAIRSFSQPAVAATTAER